MNGSDGDPPEQREERDRVTRLGGPVGRVADETMAASHPGALLRHNAVIRVKVHGGAAASSVDLPNSTGVDR